MPRGTMHLSFTGGRIRTTNLFTHPVQHAVSASTEMITASRILRCF